MRFDALAGRALLVCCRGVPRAGKGQVVYRPSTRPVKTCALPSMTAACAICLCSLLVQSACATCLCNKELCNYVTRKCRHQLSPYSWVLDALREAVSSQS